MEQLLETVDLVVEVVKEITLLVDLVTKVDLHLQKEITVEDQKYQHLEQQVVVEVVEQLPLEVMDHVTLELLVVQEHQIQLQEQIQRTLVVAVELVKDQAEVVELVDQEVAELEPQVEQQLQHLELLILVAVVEELVVILLLIQVKLVEQVVQEL